MSQPVSFPVINGKPVWIYGMNVCPITRYEQLIDYEWLLRILILETEN